MSKKYNISYIISFLISLPQYMQNNEMNQLRKRKHIAYVKNYFLFAYIYIYFFFKATMFFDSSHYSVQREIHFMWKITRTLIEREVG